MSAGLFCAHGMPLAACALCRSRSDAKPVETDVHVDVELPPWLHGMRYQSDANATIITVLVPVRDGLGRIVQQPVQFATSDAQLEALHVACGTLLDRIRKSRAVVDVPLAAERVDDDVIDVD